MAAKVPWQQQQLGGAASQAGRASGSRPPAVRAVAAARTSGRQPGSWTPACSTFWWRGAWTLARSWRRCRSALRSWRLRRCRPPGRCLWTGACPTRPPSWPRQRQGVLIKVAAQAQAETVQRQPPGLQPSAAPLRTLRIVQTYRDAGPRRSALPCSLRQLLAGAEQCHPAAGVRWGGSVGTDTLLLSARHGAPRLTRPSPAAVASCVCCCNTHLLLSGSFCAMSSTTSVGSWVSRCGALPTAARLVSILQTAGGEASGRA